MSAPVVCSVGTSDPWNAAGVGLDARVFEAFGVRGVTVIAAVSAQDGRGVHAVVPIDARAIDAQFAGLMDAGIAAFRVGALADVAGAVAIARQLGASGAPAVYDPVFLASAGGGFSDLPTYRALVTALAPAVRLLTPNLAEARTLANLPDAQPRELARALHAIGARAVLITGIARGDDLVDTLFEAGATTEFAAARIAAQSRGTGCMLAAAIAAGLARGDVLTLALERARAFVRARIVDAQEIADMRVMRLRP